MRELFFKALFLLAIVVGVLNSGCANKDKKADVKPPIIIDDEKAVRFSENNNMLNINNRNYRKMTRQRMEEEAELHAQAGSMWVMEGQGAYLFAQNKSRREGDLLKVKVEGPNLKQIETKVSVIKMLLKQLEEEELKSKEGDKKEEAPKLADAKDDKRAPASEPKAAEKEKDKDKAEETIVDLVPTRIIERQADGNYRVKGQQPFMIGKREYKVLVTGVIRPEDFNDEGVSSTKLLDPQFDVVSLRHKEVK